MARATFPGFYLGCETRNITRVEQHGERCLGYCGVNRAMRKLGVRCGKKSRSRVLGDHYLLGSVFMTATASHVADTSASCNAASFFIGGAGEVRPADRPRHD